MVRKRILVSWRFFLIWRAASKDERPGMPMSISTMSGRSSRAFSTASPPSGDSPMTSKSLSLSSKRRTPWRNSVWSSTSKHLIFGMGISSQHLIWTSRSASRKLRRRRFRRRCRLARRHSNFDARSFPFGRDHARNPAQNGNAFFDAGQSKRAAWRTAPALNADSIVFHNYKHLVVLADHLHARVPRFGVLGHVVQRFLHHAI